MTAHEGAVLRSIVASSSISLLCPPFSAFVFSFLNIFLGTDRSLFGEMAYRSVPLIGASLLDTTRYLVDPIALFVVLYYFFAKGTKFEITGTLVLSVVFGGALGYLLGASVGIVFAGATTLSLFLANSLFGLISTGMDVAFVFLAACAIVGGHRLRQSASESPGPPSTIQIHS